MVCLEITQPQIPVFKQFYELWFDRAVPRLGRLAAGDESAYSYLPASVRRFPDPDELKGLMEDAGLQERALRDPGRGDHRPAPRDRWLDSGHARQCRVSILLPPSKRR